MVVAVSYEIIKLCGKYDNAVCRAVSAPGLWLQRITTQEPDDSMIECAIAAVTPVLRPGPTKAYGEPGGPVAQGRGPSAAGGY